MWRDPLTLAAAWLAVSVLTAAAYSAIATTVKRRADADHR